RLEPRYGAAAGRELRLPPVPRGLDNRSGYGFVQRESRQQAHDRCREKRGSYRQPLLQKNTIEGFHPQADLSSPVTFIPGFPSGRIVAPQESLCARGIVRTDSAAPVR